MEAVSDYLSDFGNHSAAKLAPTTAMGLAMIFGAAIFAASTLATRAFLSGLPLKRELKVPDGKLDLTRLTSIYSFLHHVALTGWILFYAYLCEHHPPYPHATKSAYDLDEVLFMGMLIVLAALTTWRRNDSRGRRRRRTQLTSFDGDASSVQTSEQPERGHSRNSGQGLALESVEDLNDVLNRLQTDEWKGWMQMVILLGSYFNANEGNNLVRVLQSSFLWITGYGHTRYFYEKGDYSLSRVLRMVWRLHFFTSLLCLVQGTPWMLYEGSLLAIYYFLLVWIVMRVFPASNYNKWGGTRSKLGLLALLIALVWDIPDQGFLFRVVHFPLLRPNNVVQLGAAHGTLWEWYYQTSIDHWSTLLGMVFAINHPITSLLLRKLEALPFGPRLFLAKACMGIVLLGAFWIWLGGPFQQASVDYNPIHAYFCFLPILTFVYWRNVTTTQRRYHLDVFRRLGQVSLELYLLHRHIWQTSHGETLLVLVPGWPKVNFLITSCLLVWMSKCVWEATSYLRDIALPSTTTNVVENNNNKHNLKQSFRHLGILGVVVLVFLGLAWALRIFGLLNLITVGVIALTLGVLTYQFVLDASWIAYKKEVIQARPVTLEDSMLDKMAGRVGASQPSLDSWYAQLVPPVVGAMILFVMGLTWHGLAQTGGTEGGSMLHTSSTITAMRSLPLLPPGCERFVNTGQWLKVEPCQPESLGVGIRDYGITNFATCGSSSTSTDSVTWTWNKTLAGSHCNFSYRNPKSLRQALQSRTIVFVGDAMTRDMYHAQLRAMGMAGAGSYNAKAPKWSDATNTIAGDITIEFVWAALATDQVLKIREIVKRPEEKKAGGGGDVRPDLLVLGGGLSDRMHVYATDEDRESHRAIVKELAKEIRMARSENIPTVWIVPTTINSAALGTEERRQNIKEADIAGMRTLYAQLGVLSSASFVLDGPSFTSQRVDESYDGEHYPPSVYDAGAQILANALDWLLLEKPDVEQTIVEYELGVMANPPLALMMLCFLFMGLVCYDGFMGFSYLASFFAQGIMPTELSDEAMNDLHERKNVRAIIVSVSSWSGGDGDGYYLNDASTQASGSYMSGGSSTFVSEGATNNSASKTSAGASRISDGTSRTTGSANRISGHRSKWSSGGRRASSGESRSAVSSVTSGGNSTKSGGNASAASSQASIDNDVTALLKTTSKRLEMTQLR